MIWYTCNIFHPNLDLHKNNCNPEVLMRKKKCRNFCSFAQNLKVCAALSVGGSGKSYGGKGQVSCTHGYKSANRITAKASDEWIKRFVATRNNSKTRRSQTQSEINNLLPLTGFNAVSHQTVSKQGNLIWLVSKRSLRKNEGGKGMPSDWLTWKALSLLAAKYSKGFSQIRPKLSKNCSFSSSLLSQDSSRDSLNS
ncbi:hypothetical protein LOAG_09200 [Loa loa]|uniref:Uncharacterized protein n=1 Tax=Loa loa TaxID=7209 RepID=A0A1S0TSW8_LOALO|nr:hypothetical protein LOAG_09200 [Loa loa]EFO19292.1 hypothetical protein LOAG_09200 [Loa loa]